MSSTCGNLQHRPTGIRQPRCPLPEPSLHLVVVAPADRDDPQQAILHSEDDAVLPHRHAGIASTSPEAGPGPLRVSPGQATCIREKRQWPGSARHLGLSLIVGAARLRCAFGQTHPKGGDGGVGGLGALGAPTPPSPTGSALEGTSAASAGDTGRASGGAAECGPPVAAWAAAPSCLSRSSASSSNPCARSFATALSIPSRTPGHRLPPSGHRRPHWSTASRSSRRSRPSLRWLSASGEQDGRPRRPRRAWTRCSLPCSWTCGA